MECSIDAYDEVGEPSFIRHKIVRARKEHVCGECGCKINRGDRYEYVEGLWDDMFSVYKTCVVCLGIRKTLFCSYYFEGLWAAIAEADQECFGSAVVGLSKEAKDKLFLALERKKSDLEFFS